MATKEFIQERITKAQEQITKKQNLIQKMQERINKNTVKLEKLGFTTPIESAWKIDRYHPNYDKAFDLAYSNENAQESINNATKELPELEAKLQKYEAELQTIIEKESSRNVEVILTFLEGWKERMKEHFSKSLTHWIRTKKEYLKANHEYCEFHNNCGWKHHEQLEELHFIMKEANEAHMMWSFLNPYIIRNRTSEGTTYELDMEKVQKDLDQEANAKYDFIIERTNRIVGQITDASNLHINAGNMNGYIIGTKGTAKVETIGAGGYNIQCFHFRTLIHEMK